MKLKLLFITLLACFSGWGQLSITSTGTSYTQNFDGMSSSATATLPTGFKVNGNGSAPSWATGTTATTLAAGTSGTGALTSTSGGGTYNFANGVTAVASDRALGFLTSGSFASPNSIIFRFTNNTGITITNLNITFDYEKYRSGTRAWNLTFFHGNNTNPTITETNGDQAYAVDGANAVVNPPSSINKSITLTGLSIVNGTDYYLKWTSTGLGGNTNSQGIALDNFSIAASALSTSTTYTTTYTTTWSNNAPTTSIDAIIDGDLTTAADLVSKDLTINSGKTLTIGAGKKLTVSGNLINNGIIIFKSDVNGTAMFDVFNGTQSGTGVVTTERFIPSGKRAFRLLSPAVTTTTFISGNWQQQTHITGGASGGFDVTETNNPSMYTYNNQVASGTGWTAIANTNATNLTAGVGYRMLVRGDRTATNITAATTDNMNTAITLSATGTLKTGTVTLNASSTPAINNTANTTTADYSLVGNPYQSAVDWNAVTKSGIDASYYAWDPNMGTTAQRGRYVVFNGTTNDNVLSQVGQFIQPGQAFFVKNNTPATAGTLTFQEANKATTNANVFRTVATSTLAVALYDPNELAIDGYPIDATKAIFSSDYSNELGLGDATKLEAAGENIAWFKNNTKLAIDAAAPVTTSDELALKTLRLGANKNYTFKIKTTNFDTALTPYLVDAFLNTQTEITTSQAFLASFATTSNAASYSENRFKVVFTNAVLNTDTFSTQVGLYPNPSKGNGFYLQLPSTVQATVKLYNTIGQEIAITNNSGYYQANQSLATGVYHIMVAQGEKTSKLKWIVE
jgi:hypothetical protein